MPLLNPRLSNFPIALLFWSCDKLIRELCNLIVAQKANKQGAEEATMSKPESLLPLSHGAKLALKKQ